jgi:hypothetical protein
MLFDKAHQRGHLAPELAERCCAPFVDDALCLLWVHAGVAQRVGLRHAPTTAPARTYTAAQSKTRRGISHVLLNMCLGFAR